MGNELSTKSFKIVIRGNHTTHDDNGITTHSTNPNETWSQLCRRTIENDYLSNKLLPLLIQIYPSKRLAAYRLRYDTGYATIIKPTWNAANGIQNESPVEDAFLDVNVSLRPCQTMNDVSVSTSFAPYETIESSLGEGGSHETTFVELHCEKIGMVDDDDGVGRIQCPFPVVKALTRVLLCREHEYFAGCIDDYSLVEASDSDDGENIARLPRRCVNIFRDGGDEIMEEESEEESKEESEEEIGQDEGQIGESVDTVEGPNEEVPVDELDGGSHEEVSTENVGKSKRKRTQTSSKEINSSVPNESGDDQGGSSKEDEPATVIQEEVVVPGKADAVSTTNSTGSKAATGPNGTVKKKKQTDSSKEVSVGAAMKQSPSNGKAADIEKSPSKKKEAAAPKKGKTDAQADAGKSQSKKSSKKADKVVEDVEPSPYKKKRSKQTTEETASKTATHISETLAVEHDGSTNENKKPSRPRPKKQKAMNSASKGRAFRTGKDDSEYPAEPAPGFPDGWTLRRIPRARNPERKDSQYYSPHMEYHFRVKKDAKRFIELLGEYGDEEAAMLAFRETLKSARSAKKPPKTNDNDDVGGGDDDMKTKKDVPKGKAKRKRPGASNATKKALKEQADVGEESSDEGEKAKKKAKLVEKGNQDVDGGKEKTKPRKKGPRIKKVLREFRKDGTIVVQDGKVTKDVESVIEGSSPGRKKKSNAGSPDKPKRPSSAYELYCKDFRSKFMEENPGLPTKEVKAILTEAYKSLPDDEQKPYKNKAKEAMKKYKADMAAHEKAEAVEK